ncbi:MAG: NRDE family protein [Mycobacteriales bacterium]
MCTVIVRRDGAGPAEVLAVRDELVGRPFDDPGRWWPEQPDVVGGRDRQAGGSWCVTDVRRGRTALVLNRPLRRVADPGAPSRGVLPLLAAEHGPKWVEHLDPGGMATFTVVLVEPDSTLVWDFDGDTLLSRALPSGTAMVTSGGAEDGKADRFLPAFDGAPVEGWPDLVAGQVPLDDPAALVVHHPVALPDGTAGTFATVLVQQLRAVPGRLDVAWSRTPELTPWSTSRWQ